MAVRVESETIIFPVEYIAGESVPEVAALEFVTFIFPSPLSVAIEAQ